jgi:hypothetical protein
MESPGFTTFDGMRRLATGTLPEAGLAARRALAAAPPHPVLVIDDRTGRNIDLDLEGDEAQVSARLERVAATLARASAPSAAGADTVATGQDAAAAGPRGRGRPKLGVVPKEVTLLPRHWDWLATQPGGPSAALRRLVEEAKRANVAKDRQRVAQGRAYYFMLAIAGDLPGYEEATRALFAGDRAGLERETARWPADVREHALRLAQS